MDEEDDEDDEPQAVVKEESQAPELMAPEPCSRPEETD